jgi:hypothetical protein
MSTKKASGVGSSWKDDKGVTLYPSVYVPFNECDETLHSNYVPSAIGRTTMTCGSSDKVIEPTTNRVYYSGSTVQNRFVFGNVIGGTNPTSYHDLVLSPAANIGKFIVIALKIKITPAPSTFTTVIFFNGYVTAAGTGGLSLDFKSGTTDAVNQFRHGIRYSGSGTTIYDSSATGPWWQSGVWSDMYLIYNPSDANTLNIKLFMADSTGVLVNSGSPILSLSKIGAIPNLHYDGISTILGYNGGCPLEVKDFVAYVDNTDPTINGNLTNLLNWRARPNNDFQFPDFLRKPSKSIVKPTRGKGGFKVGYYCSDSPIDGSAGRTINDQYSFWQKWGVQDYAFRGLHIGMGIAAFQPTAGVYNTADLSALATWLSSRGIGLKIMLQDQTYSNINEMPTHFPYWTVNVASPQRIGTIWDDIENLDVDAWLQNPTQFDTYNSALASNGTYRMFHHVYTLLKTLKSFSCFEGVTLAETAGSAYITTDTLVNGVSNPVGIYGITDTNGVYILGKIYSRQRQLMYYDKMMKFISGYLNSFNRTDVTKSIQINYMRGGIISNYSGFTQSGSTLTKTSHGLVSGRGLYLLHGSYNSGISMGLAYDTLYYVVGATTDTLQLSLTVGGTPISLKTVSDPNQLYLQDINSYIELELCKARVPSSCNGFSLQEPTREVFTLINSCRKYGFGLSGPDITTAGIENPAYGENGAASISPVQIRLEALTGTGFFKGLGPLVGMEIQAQTSAYTTAYPTGSTNMDTLISNHGSTASGYISADQSNTYAIHRLKVDSIVWILNQAYTEKALPAVYDAIRKHNLTKV